MKLIVFVCCLVIVTATSVDQKHFSNTEHLNNLQKDIFDDIAAQIENLIIGLIGQLKPYDPSDVAKYTINFSEFSAVFKDIHAEGFSHITPKVFLSSQLLNFKAKLTLNLPKVSASIKSWESNIPLLYGNGAFDVNITNAEVSINVQYSIFNGIQPSEVVISIGNANVYVTGFLNSPELSKKLADLLIYLLNTFMNSEELHTILGQLLDTIIGNLLGGVLKIY